MRGIDVFGIPVIQTGFFVIHDAVGIAPIVVHIFQVFPVLGDAVEVAHGRHDHEQAVHPV